jgi:endonuclease YncB( thermonuclease family)
MAVVSEQRKAELIAEYGDEGCITRSSLLTAMFNEVTDLDDFNADEFDWMYKASNTACTPTQEEDPITSSKLPATVAEIIDGDTIRVMLCQDLTCQLTPLGGAKVRLWHVSAPDTTYASGREAKSWLETKLPAGTQVSLDIRGIDPYDRLTAVVFKGTENINDAIVAAGHAQEWTVDDQTVADVPLPAQPGDIPASTGIQLISVTVPETVGVTGNAWWSAEIKNIGTETKRFYLGVSLANPQGQIFEYSGNSQYAVLITPGKTGTLRANFDIPEAYWSEVEVELRIKAVDE